MLYVSKTYPIVITIWVVSYHKLIYGNNKMEVFVFGADLAATNI